jgi:hypothetical protein
MIFINIILNSLRFQNDGLIDIILKYFYGYISIEIIDLG